MVNLSERWASKCTASGRLNPGDVHSCFNIELHPLSGNGLFQRIPMQGYRITTFLNPRRCSILSIGRYVQLKDSLCLVTPVGSTIKVKLMLRWDQLKKPKSVGLQAVESAKVRSHNKGHQRRFATALLVRAHYAIASFWHTQTKLWQTGYGRRYASQNLLLIYEK